MANFNLVIDTSNFKPFSYKDIMAPYEDYAKDYDTRKAEIEKYIDTYGNLTLPLGSKINEEYLKYLALQNNALEDFYLNGLNATTGAALTRAFNVNKGTVKKMQEAAKSYLELLAKKNDYENKGFIVSGLDNEAADIDALYLGKKPKLTAINRDLLIDTATKMFSKMNDSRLNLANYRAVSVIKNLYQALVQKGLDSDSALLIASGNLSNMILADSDLARSMGVVLGSIPGYQDLNTTARQLVFKSLGVALLSSVSDKSTIVEDKTLENSLKVNADKRAKKYLKLAKKEAKLKDAIYKATYKIDNGNITGYGVLGEPKRTTPSTPVFTMDGKDYSISYNGGNKTIIRHNPDGTLTILSATDPDAIKVRQELTGDPSINEDDPTDYSSYIDDYTDTSDEDATVPWEEKKKKRTIH